MAIDTRFADWYHAAAIDPKTVALEQRWKGVLAAVNAADSAMLADVIRMACHRQVASADLRTRFQGYFKHLDPAFLLIDNDQELAVLAATVLSQLLQVPAFADSVALLVRSAAFSGWTFVINLTDLAEDHLRRRSIEVRKIAPPSLAVSAGKDGSWAAELAAARTETAAQPALTALLAKVSGSIPAEAALTIGSLQAVLAHTIRSHAVVSEELDILWWLFADRSSTHGALWRDVGAVAVTLTAPLELNDLIYTVPGPIASREFLTRVFQSAGADGGGTTTLGEAIAASSSSWHVAVKALSDLGNLTPLVAAGKAWVDSDNGWSGRAELASGISLREPRPRLDIGVQFLGELWLLRLQSSAAWG